jgi:hypothetical protein
MHQEQVTQHCCLRLCSTKKAGHCESTASAMIRLVMVLSKDTLVGSTNFRSRQQRCSATLQSTTICNSAACKHACMPCPAACAAASLSCSEDNLISCAACYAGFNLSCYCWPKLLTVHVNVENPGAPCLLHWSSGLWGMQDHQPAAWSTVPCRQAQDRTAAGAPAGVHQHTRVRCVGTAMVSQLASGHSV